MKTLSALLDKSLFKLISIAAQLLLLSAVIAGFYQVFTRFVLSSPAEWTEAWTRSSIIWVVFLGLILAFRRGEMLKVDVLNTLLSPGARRYLRHLANTICAIFLGLLTWIGANMAYRVRFQSIAGLDFSIAWIYAAIPIGCGIALIALLINWFGDNSHIEQNIQE